jgi:hypothetical protein
MAEGVADTVISVPKAAGNFFTHKLGPLPVWAWGGILAVGVAAYLWYQSQQSGATNATQAALNAAGVGSPLGSGGYGGYGGSSTTPAAATLTNSSWLQTVLASAAATAGVPLNEAQLYLNDYLAGTAPNLSGQYETNYQNVIAAALGLGGAPPTAPNPSGVNTNPFTNNTTWLNEILSFLPSGTFEGESASQIQSALSNLINGTSTTLTQAEADALGQAQNVVGNAPTPLSFTISQAAAAAAAGASTLTQNAINAWDNAYLSLPVSSQTYSTWVSQAPAAITGALTPTQLSSVYNYFNSKAGQSAVAASGGPLGWWNTYLANPVTLPGGSGGGQVVVNAIKSTVKA